MRIHNITPTILVLLLSLPSTTTMSLKHKVTRKIYQQKFSRYMHTVVSTKQIPSIYSKPELKGRDYQLFQYSENLISTIVINHSRYMHTVVSMKQISSIYSKPELKGRDYPLFI